MSREQHSSKVPGYVWKAVAACLIAAAGWFGRSAVPAPDPEPPTPRSIEDAKKEVAERKSEPTTDAVELRFRELQAEIAKERARIDEDRAVMAVLWPELYEEVSRRVQLEAIVRQPKNKTAASDAFNAFETRAGLWNACPATPQALEERRAKPLHKAGDSALHALKIQLER